MAQTPLPPGPPKELLHLRPTAPEPRSGRAQAPGSRARGDTEALHGPLRGSFRHRSVAEWLVYEGKYHENTMNIPWKWMIWKYPSIYIIYIPLNHRMITMVDCTGDPWGFYMSSWCMNGDSIVIHGNITIKSHKVVPQFVSQVGANKSNFTTIYRWYIYS